MSSAIEFALLGSMVGAPTVECPLPFMLPKFLACSPVQEHNPGLIELRQALLDVATEHRLLAVAAHPDDEDVSTLTVLRRKDGVRTAVALGTRGEGGQNEMGPELMRALGVIRTREMEEAARLHGAEIVFLNLPDFGFSKSADETFRIWDHRETERRLVRVIREFRPHVLISNHDTKNGHGHHQALGIVMLEAFDAAADPNFDPDLGKAWAVAKCYVRSTPATAAVVIDSRARDVVRGETFFDLAVDALRRHRSQGTWESLIGSRHGRHYYALVRSRVGEGAETGLFDRVPELSDCLKASGADRVAREIEMIGDRVQSSSIPSRPADLATSLGRYLGLVRKLAARADLSLFREGFDSLASRIERALTLAVGAQIVATVYPAVLVPGEPVRIQAEFSTAGPSPGGVRLSLSGCVARATVAARSVADPQDVIWAGRVSEDARRTLPAEEHLFDEPSARSAIRIRAEWNVAGLPVSIEETVLPEVDAPVSVSAEPSPVWSRAGEPATIRLLLRNRLSRPVTGTWVVCGSTPQKFAIDKGGEHGETVRLNPLSREGGEEKRAATVMLDGRAEPIDVREIIVRRSTVEVPESLRVAVVESYDRTISETLRALGIAYRTLEASDLAVSDLSAYETILVDLRGYGAREDLRECAGRVLEYVRAGGHLVVFYHKPEDFRADFAPLPLELSRDRVTVEAAPVKLLAPDHPLLSRPNRIAPEDFDGWVQERGLYFPKPYDRGYTELLAMSDPGEAEQRGGLLVCRAGRGSYVYTSLVWYRQLRDFHPGTLKVFVNLVSYPRFRER